MSTPEATINATPGSHPSVGAIPLEADLLAALRQVIDPELGCNIVDLGLIYSVAPRPGGVTVAMTVTTPGCPMHCTLAAGVETALRTVPGIREVEVRTVWDPPWNPSMIAPRVRAALGFGDS